MPNLFGSTSGPSGPPAGLLAALAGGQSVMPQPGKPKLRLAKPAEGLTGTAFYDALAQGDPAAEAQLRKVFSDVRTSSMEGRELIERGWWQKLLYINGRQWIYYTSRGGWADKRMARWIPRPVTNICSDTVQSVRAMLSGVELSARIRPEGSDPINSLTAGKCDELEPAINEEHRMQSNFFEADWWTPALGVSLLHPHWDRDDSTHTEFVQSKQCPQCGYLAHPLDVAEGKVEGCPDCGTPAEAFVDGVDQSGEPIGQNEIVGRGATAVVSPLEVLIPVYFQRWADVDRLIRLTWRPKSYYEGRDYFSEIQFRSTPADRSLQMYRALAMMTDLATTPYSGTGATGSRVEGTIEAELWMKPNAQYPDGLWCRSVGGQHGEAFIIRDEERGIMPGPLPYRDVKSRPLWPWIYYPYEEQGGRIWARGCLDSIISKQDQINRNDSMVELIMQRMANPIWLEPKGSEVQRFTGEPGLIVRYQVVAGTQAKPERLEGMMPGTAHFTLREQYFADAERLAGTSDVLKGVRPTGVEAFSALNLLVERSQSRFTSLFKARGRAYRDWFEVAIELERVYGPRERTITREGARGLWMSEVFLKKDLQGSISVIVEDGSDTPKTSLGKRAALQQLQQMGFRFDDPDKQYQVYELIGLTSIAPTLSAQIQAAQVEHEQYEQWVHGGRLDPKTGQPSQVPMAVNPLTGQPQAIGPAPGNPLTVYAWQDHQIFKQQIDIWANSDKMRALLANDPLAVIEVTTNRTQHIVATMNPFGLPTPQQQPGVLPGSGAPAPGAPAGGPGGGGGMAMANSNQESGAPDTLPGAAPGGGNMAVPN